MATTSNRFDPDPSTVSLTPMEMKLMNGRILRLVSYRKNKKEKQWIKSVTRAELHSISSIYGSENKIINLRLLDEDMNVFKSIILASDGTHIKDPSEISNTYYKIIL